MIRLMSKTAAARTFSRAAFRTLLSAGAVLSTLLATAPAAGTPPAKSPPESAWVSISYRDLLDPEALTHSGAKLVDSLNRKASRAEVQPFLDPYSSLLGYAVQMLAGADTVTQISLAERYPAGTAQPAWAAILREGRYFVSTDGQGRARVFVPGDEPRAAYRRAYSLLRHPLAAALTPGAPLEVEVFSYRNDYAAAELHLNPVPYRLRAKSFPAQGRPLDLNELEAFFRQGGQLEGVELPADGGLVLYASQVQQQRLGGEAVSLADLAVAYRAVFHAGDAEAFVSLDPNADPTLATVNFGGLLEDTRIGKAVLAADMRFKTLCSGLDPVTYADIREKTRGAVPSFMSNFERHFLTNPAGEPAQWVSARYWYYPDSCGVESDENDRLAAITKTQLTADVERIEAGTGGARGKKPTLPALFRENIRDLNKNYARYTTIFPEYRDLSSAARLFALAAWLGRVRPESLDLDGLLAVTLPPESTPRTLPQLVSAEILDFPMAQPPDRDFVIRNTRIQNLKPELDKKVAEFFGDPRHLAVFLALQAGKEPARFNDFTAEAERLFPDVKEKRVRELLRTSDDLRAFLRSYVARLNGEKAAAERQESARDRARLDQIRAELAALPPAPEGAGEADNPQRQSLEEALREIMSKYHAQGRKAGITTIVATNYTGGVSLAPRLFSVKKSATRPALQKLQTASLTAGTTWGAAGWIRSAKRSAATLPGVSPTPTPMPTPSPTLLPTARPTPTPSPTPTQTSAPKPTFTPAPVRLPRPAAEKPGFQPPPPDDVPEEVAPPLPAATPAMKSIAVPGSATPAGSPLVGRLGEGRRIVFTRAAR